MGKDGKSYRIVSDQLGSVRLVMDASTGEIAQQLNYDAWGQVIQDSNPGFQPFDVRRTAGKFGDAGPWEKSASAVTQNQHKGSFSDEAGASVRTRDCRCAFESRVYGGWEGRFSGVPQPPEGAASGVAHTRLWDGSGTPVRPVFRPPNCGRRGSVARRTARVPTAAAGGAQPRRHCQGQQRRRWHLSKGSG